MIRPLLALILLLPQSLAACTAFCASGKGRVLFANNEDYIDPDTRVWFFPAEKGAYGRMFVGFTKAWPQGGLNEKGLAFDGFAAQRIDRSPSGKLPFDFDWGRARRKFPGGALDKMLAECATVGEVVRLWEKYEFGFLDRAMILVADATGDAAVLEANAVVRKQGRFLVQTNFRQSMTKPGEIPCERFKIATAMLDAAGEEFTLDLCRRVLAATHQEAPGATVYSNICDLKCRVVYLYHFHNFENVVEFDLARELAKGEHSVEIASLFPRTWAAEAWKKRQTGKK